MASPLNSVLGGSGPMRTELYLFSAQMMVRSLDRFTQPETSSSSLSSEPLMQASTLAGEQPGIGENRPAAGPLSKAEEMLCPLPCCQIAMPVTGRTIDCLETGRIVPPLCFGWKHLVC